MIRFHGNPQRACLWHLGALEAARLVASWGDRRVAGVLRALRASARSHLESPWSSQCLDRGMAVAGELAKMYHLDGRHTGNDALYREADRWYRLALAGWGAPARSHALRFYRAEALYHADGCRAAAPLYEQVAAEAGRFAKEAAKNTLWCARAR